MHIQILHTKNGTDYQIPLWKIIFEKVWLLITVLLPSKTFKKCSGQMQHLEVAGSLMFKASMPKMF